MKLQKREETIVPNNLHGYKGSNFGLLYLCLRPHTKSSEFRSKVFLDRCTAVATCNYLWHYYRRRRFAQGTYQRFIHVRRYMWSRSMKWRCITVLKTSDRSFAGLSCSWNTPRSNERGTAGHITYRPNSVLKKGGLLHIHTDEYTQIHSRAWHFRLVSIHVFFSLETRPSPQWSTKGEDDEPGKWVRLRLTYREVCTSPCLKVQRAVYEDQANPRQEQKQVVRRAPSSSPALHSRATLFATQFLYVTVG